MGHGAHDGVVERPRAARQDVGHGVAELARPVRGPGVSDLAEDVTGCQAMPPVRGPQTGPRPLRVGYPVARQQRPQPRDLQEAEEQVVARPDDLVAVALGGRVLHEAKVRARDLREEEVLDGQTDDPGAPGSRPEHRGHSERHVGLGRVHSDQCHPLPWPQREGRSWV